MKFRDDIESYYGLTLVGEDKARVRKEASFSTRECYIHTKAVINHFIRNPDPLVVPIYSFEELEATLDNQYGTYRYAYTMKRLGMLDSDERRIIDEFHSWDSEVDRDHHSEWFRLGWKQYPTLMDFMNVVHRQKRYRDLHGGNFLKDENNDYKIIDLEGFSTYPLDQAINDWITR
jgi:hypothetical protein